MSVVFIDGPMVEKFLKDSDAFGKCIEERFNTLDVNKDGVLSRDELRNEATDLASVELMLQSKEEVDNVYDAIFEKFDTGKKGTLKHEEFSLLMKEVIQAQADGIGKTPVCIILQEDSLLQKVV
ncbi:Calcium-binding EF-hand [Artemisia annua]|uniref:Calcium-binding EF-hand n=1 Tax=Artemisia annua TaxID=35608 RepID=A0A2U1LHI4_ARTAN|nr:Calcium-binding EF-hand [Artemisia annua]